jgi:hypothetical protein
MFGYGWTSHDDVLAVLDEAIHDAQLLENHGHEGSSYDLLNILRERQMWAMKWNMHGIFEDTELASIIPVSSKHLLKRPVVKPFFRFIKLSVFGKRIMKVA